MHKISRAQPPIICGTRSTPIGDLLLFSWGETIIAVEFRDRAQAEPRIRRFLPQVEIVAGEMPENARQALDRYFEHGDCGGFDQLQLDPFGSDFQLRVWQQLREIPAGSILSYGELARRIGSPRAARAVGAANGQNPIPIFIPCHRVLGSNGTLTGYGSGLERKMWLLRNEGVDLVPDGQSSQSSFRWA